MKLIVNKSFAPRRTNRYQKEERRQPINTDILVGWVCCAVITAAFYYGAFLFIRWAMGG